MVERRTGRGGRSNRQLLLSRRQNHWGRPARVIPYPDGSARSARTFVRRAFDTPGCFQPGTMRARSDPRTGGVVGGDMYLVRLARTAERLLRATLLRRLNAGAERYGRNSTAKAISSSPAHARPRSTTRGCFQTEVPPVSGHARTKMRPDLTKLIGAPISVARRRRRAAAGHRQDDSVVVVGTSPSADFPTRPGVVQPSQGARDSERL